MTAGGTAAAGGLRLARPLTEFAPAKINLALHVTGQRPDGYHLLDSLVAFADVGDRLQVHPAEGLELAVTGPRAAGVPLDDGNLALRAARAMGVTRGLRIVLDKRLPMLAGVGGGSSDAAAVLRLLQRSGLQLPADRGLSLGADVPACLLARPCRMRGIGERVEELPRLPDLHLVLLNPGVAVATADVFRRLARKDNSPLPRSLPDWRDAAALADWLRSQRNDLEPPAAEGAPRIAQALAALRETEGCLLARMSGSGATCFGLYAGASAAKAAETRLRTACPGWWCAAASGYRCAPSEGAS